MALVTRTDRTHPGHTPDKTAVSGPGRTGHASLEASCSVRDVRSQSQALRVCVEQRMQEAKSAFTDAASAAQRGDKNAGELTDSALLELDAARAALRELDAAEGIAP
jgi:outer membrane murein-binding lipoprotein Lpp